jgi:hypothetical protein
MTRPKPAAPTTNPAMPAKNAARLAGARARESGPVGRHRKTTSGLIGKLFGRGR